MKPLFRTSTLLGAALLLLLAGTGCSKKTTRQVGTFDLTPEEADEMVQQVGMATAYNTGGWLNEIQQLASIPKPTGVGTVPDSVAHPVVPGTSRYDLFYHFLNQRSIVIDTLAAGDTVSEMSATVASLGTITQPDPSFVNGTYFHNTSASITGYDTSDSVMFIGSTDDTLKVEFKPLTTTPHRFYFTSILGSYDETWVKLPNKYPLSGTFDVDLSCEIWNSDYTQLIDDIDGNTTVTFNGTNTVTIGVWNFIESNGPKFNYTLNLDTGVVTRQF